MNIAPSKRLTDLLSNYLEFDQKKISLGLWSGDLEIYSVQLKKDAFFPLLNTWKNGHSTNPDLASFFTDDELLKEEPSFASAINLKLVQGSIGHFRARVPWKKLLLGSSDACLHLELIDVTICIGLESCISKALENGQLEKLHSKDTFNFSVLPSLSSAQSKERLWKKEMIRIAEQHISEKKDIPTPEEYSKLKADFLSSLTVSEKVKTKSFLESFVKNFASTLGWRCGQGLKVDLQNIRIIFEQDEVEVGVFCQSIEIEDAPKPAEKLEDPTSLLTYTDDSIRKQLLVSDCGVYVRPIPTQGIAIVPHVDDFVIKPTNLSALITLRKGTRTMTFDQLDQEYQNLEMEEVPPKVRRGKRDKRKKSERIDTTLSPSSFPKTMGNASNSSSQSSVDMEQIISLSAKIDQELVKDDFREMSAAISIKITVEHIIVLLSKRLLDLGNKFLGNAIRVKRGRPEQALAVAANLECESVNSARRLKVYSQWWRYSYFVTLRCIRRKRRLLDEFACSNVSLGASTFSELKAHYIDSFSCTHLKLVHQDVGVSSDDIHYNLSKLFLLEDQMPVEQIVLFRHMARIKVEATLNQSIGSLSSKFYATTSLRRQNLHANRSNSLFKENGPRQHRSSRSLLPPLLIRSNSGKIPIHQRNQSLSVQSIVESLESVPTSRHHRHSSDLSSIMEDKSLSEGNVAFKETFEDAIKQYDGLVSSYLNKGCPSSSSGIPISVTSSVSFTLTAITVYVCIECLDKNVKNENDDDDVSILTVSTLDYTSQDKAESCDSKYIQMFGSRHEIVSYFVLQLLRYSSHTEQGGSIKYKRYTVDSFGTCMLGKEVIAIGRIENFLHRFFPVNAQQFPQVSTAETQSHLDPFISGKMTVFNEKNQKNSLHLKVAAIRVHVALDDVKLLINYALKVQNANYFPTPLPLSVFDEVRLKVLSTLRARQYDSIGSGKSVHVECDGFRLMICSSESNIFCDSRIEMTVLAKTLSYTQQFDDNTDTAVGISFRDAFTEFPADKFRNKVISVVGLDIKLNESSLIQSPLRLDVLQSVLSDPMESDRARRSAVILVSPITMLLSSSISQSFQILVSDVQEFMYEFESHKSNDISEIPRLSELVCVKNFRLQVIAQGLKVLFENHDFIPNFDALEARVIAIQSALTDLLALAICFFPPFKNEAILVAKLICEDRLLASGLPRKVCVESVEHALAKLVIALENSLLEKRPPLAPLKMCSSGQFGNTTINCSYPTGVINDVVKAVVDDIVAGECSISWSDMSWKNALIFDMPSGFRMDWEKYTFDCMMSLAVPSLCLRDGFGATFVEIRNTEQEQNSDDYATASTYSIVKDSGILFSMCKCDKRWDFLDGGSPLSMLLDDLSIQQESSEKAPLHDVSLSLTSLKVLFADKQWRNASEAFSNLLCFTRKQDLLTENSSTQNITATTLGIDIKSTRFLFATDELQPFCSLMFSELILDLAKSKDFELQNRSILVTAKTRDFRLDDLSPEGQIYANVLHPIYDECSNHTFPFQTTLALSSDPTVYQNEIIILLENMRCVLLRRFVNELLQYFMYTNYGLGHFLSVQFSSVNQSSSVQPKSKLPINFHLHLLDSLVICPQSSECEDLISFKAKKIVMSHNYIRDSWSIPTVGDSVRNDCEDISSVIGDSHDDDSKGYDFGCIHEHSGSVVFEESGSFDHEARVFDSSALVSRVTVSLQDLQIFVGTSDQQISLPDEWNDDLYHLSGHLQISTKVSHNRHVFISDSLPKHLSYMSKRFHEVCLRRWCEITDHPVQLEVLSDFVQKTQMRVLVRDRITYASEQEEEVCPFEIKLKMSHLHSILSTWYGNMQELALIFPLSIETIYDAIHDPPCPSLWPEFGSEGFVERILSIDNKILEIAASFKKLKITCLYDSDSYYPNPLNCSYMINPETDRIVMSSDFFTIHTDFNSEKIMRCSLASRSFQVEDIRPSKSIYENVLSMKGEISAIPSKPIDITWGLKNDLKAPQENLDFAFQVTIFLTPDRWCLANIGMKEIVSTTKDLAFFWLVLEYFSAYFLNPQYGNPYFSVSLKRLESLEKIGIEREDIDPDDTCRNLDIRLWLPKPNISIPQNPLSDSSDFLILKSNTGGLTYRYRTVGYSFSSQDIVTRDLDVLFLTETGVRTQLKSDFPSRVDDSAKSLITSLCMDVTYEKFVSTSHVNASIDIHSITLPNASSILEGIEPSSSQLSPIAISSPTVCKPIMQLTRHYFPSTCDIIVIPEYLKVAFDLMYAFTGPFPDNPSSPEYASSTFSVTTYLEAVRFFICEPVLGIHFPIGVVCISDLKATLSNINPNTLSCNSLQTAVKFELWIDYFKSGPTRSWEPLIEPFQCTIMYEKSSVRGEGFSITSNCPLHVNFSGAFLETLDFARRSLQESIYKALGKNEKVVTNDLQNNLDEDNSTQDAQEVRKTIDEFSIEVTHEKTATLRYNDRVAFSLINLTGQTLRYHRYRYDQELMKTNVGYLDNLRACELEFPPTRTVIRNLHIVEVTSDVFGHIDDLPDYSHYLDIQVPGAMWSHKISVDVTGKRLLRLQPRSDILSKKLGKNWQLANAFSALVDVSYFEGGRQMTLSSPFEVINRTRHNLQLVIHPDPEFMNQRTTFGTDMRVSAFADGALDHQSSDAIVAVLNPDEIFHVPILLMQSALTKDGGNIGSLWIHPKSDNCYHGDNGSNVVYGMSSKACHLAQLIEETSDIFSASPCHFEKYTSTGHLLSCPVIDTPKQDTHWPFCYCIEVRRSPIVAPFPGHGINEIETSLVAGQADVEVGPETSFDGTGVTDGYVRHGPVAYSLAIHPPIVLENLLPEPARFEIMLLSNRHVVWYNDLKPGESVPVHTVGLDSGLLLLINVGYCRTPNGGGALIHPGSKRVQQSPTTRINDAKDYSDSSALTSILHSQESLKLPNFPGRAVRNSPNIPDRYVISKPLSSTYKEDTYDEDDSDFEEVSTHHTLVDSLGQRLVLNIDNKVGGGGQRTITISCPYWIVNTTEYALRYKQDRSNVFVSGTIHSPDKDGSKPVDCSRRKVENNRAFIDTIFPGRPGALSFVNLNRGQPSKSLLEIYTELLSKDIPLNRLADMSFMFNYNEQHVTSQSSSRICLQVTVPYSQGTLNSEWSHGFSLETIGVPQIIGMHCLDGKQLEVSVSVSVPTGKLAAYTKILRIVPRYVVVNLLGRPFRLWQDSSLVHPSKVINDSKFSTETNQGLPNWKKRHLENDQDASLTPYNFLFGLIPSLDYHKKTEMKVGTVAHPQALYITTVETNQMLPFHLPDTRSDRELRIDLGPNWNLSSSFPADIISEHYLELSRVVDLRLLKHVDNRARSKYKIVIPPPNSTDFDIGSWDGELGIWFETIQWNDGRKIVVKGTKRGKFSYNNTDIHIGDELYAIDGKVVATMDFNDVMSLLKERLAEILDRKFRRKKSQKQKNRPMKPMFLQRLKRNNVKEFPHSIKNESGNFAVEDDPNILTLHFLTLEHRMRKVRENALQKKGTKIEDEIEEASHQMISPRKEPIDSLQSSRKNMFDIDISMKLLNQSIFVFVKERTCTSPYRIENRSIDFSLYFRQKSCDNHPWKSLNPGESREYTWEEPMKANKLLIRVGNPRKLANREKKGFKFRPSRLIVSEDQGGFGPATMVKLDEVGFQGLIECPDTDDNMDDSHSVSFEHKFLFCSISTDGATRVLVISGVESLDIDHEFKVMNFQSDLLKYQIQEETLRLKRLQNMQISTGKDHSGELSTVNEDDDGEVENTCSGCDLLDNKLLESMDHAGEGVITRTHQLLVEVLEATGLQGNNSSDFSRVCNPFCSVRLENRSTRQNFFSKQSSTQRTYFIESTLSPKWNGMTFIFDVPSEAETDPQKFGILVKVKDFHVLGKSKSMGMTEIHLRNLKNQKEILGWYPLMSRTGRASDVLNTAASSRVRGSIKLRIQWIYSTPALLDYFILLSNDKLNDLTHNLEGIRRRIDQIQSEERAKQESSMLLSLSNKIPQLSALNRSTDSPWPFSLRHNMRNSKIRQLFGRQSRTSDTIEPDNSRKQLSDDFTRKSIKFDDSVFTEHSNSNVASVLSAFQDPKIVSDEAFDVECDVPKRKISSISDVIPHPTDSLARSLLASNVILHSSKESFHQNHTAYALPTHYRIETVLAKRNLLLKSWVLAYEFLNDPKIVSILMDDEMIFKQRPRDASQAIENIFPSLILPPRAPQLMKQRNVEFQRSLQKSRSDFEKASQRSLLAVVNPGGWLKLRPISALHLPQDYIGMFVKIRYGSETCVTPTVDAKVTPVWSDESKWLNHTRSVDSHHDAFDFFSRQETDLEVRVEPMLTGGSLQLSIYGTRVNSKVELGYLNIPLSNAISCCTEMHQSHTSVVDGVYIRWFPLKSGEVFEPCDLAAFSPDSEAEKISDDQFSQYYTPCIKLALWWVPDQDLFFESDCTPSNIENLNKENANKSLFMNRYLNASVESISAALIDSYQGKELVSMKCIDVDARCSSTKPVTQVSFALGHFQIDHQGNDSYDSVVISPANGFNPTPTVQLLAIKDNIRSNLSVDSFKHVAFAIDEMNVRIEEDMIMDVIELYRRLIRRKKSRKQSLLRGAAGRMAMHTGGKLVPESNDQGFRDDFPLNNEVLSAVISQMKTQEETNRIYIEKLMLGALKLNISYIKSSRKARANHFGDRLRFFPLSSKAWNKDELGEETEFQEAGDIDAFKRWSEFGFEDEVTNAEIKDIFSSVSFISASIFSSISDSPIRVNAKQINNVFEPLDVIGNQLRHYYMKEMIYQMYKVVLSLEAIGNPTMVVNSFMKGASDFVILPFKEFIRSPHNPSRLGLGLAKGALSLVSNISSGIFGFVSKTTAFGGTLAASLSFDDRYVRWHVQQAADHARHRHSQFRPKGCDLALSAFAKPVQDIFAGIVFATSGLVVEPVRGAQQQGLAGFTRGLGIGTIGLISKPIVGVFDALAHITESIHDLSLSANVFERRANIMQKIRLPYIFSLHKILLPYNPIDSRSANLLKQFPVKERRNVLSENENEVIVISEAMRVEQGLGVYIVVTTKRAALFDVTLDGSVAPKMRWQVFLDRSSYILSRIDNYLHNGVILRITKYDSEQSSLTSPKRKDLPNELNTSNHDDYSAISDNRVTAFNAVTNPFSGLGTVKAKKERKSIYTVYGDFHNRARLTRIHNAICCLTSKLENVSYSVGASGSNQGITTFGPLHFESEDQGRSSSRIITRLDEIPWIHDFNVPCNYDRNSWTFADEYEQARKAGGPNWMISARAQATFTALKLQQPRELDTELPEVKDLIKRQKAGLISYDEATACLDELAKSYQLSLTPSHSAESVIFQQGSAALSPPFEREDQSNDTLPSFDESHFAQRLANVEQLLQNVIRNSSIMSQTNQSVRNYHLSSVQRENNCNVSTVSALTGIDEMEVDMKNQLDSFDATSFENERLRREVEELRRQLAEKNDGVVWREEESQTTVNSSSKRRKRKRIFRNPWKVTK